MIFLFIFLLECIAGFFLFAKILLDGHDEILDPKRTVSVIIPARNEETNLPHLLRSLQEQTIAPAEIIVVDDFSEDRTSEIAREFGATVIQNSALPAGWTGKTWAVWNGYLHSTGDILVFLDADVRLSPNALETLLKARQKSGGAISAVPYHYMEKFYEKLSMVVCLLGIFAFTSPFERKRSRSLYGSCIVATREDYVKIQGHDSIRSELLDDLNLGKRFAQCGIPVKNFIGYGMVSFRMYPYGIKSELQGFGKGAVLGMNTLWPGTTVLIAFWLIGLLVTGLATPFLLAFHLDLGYYFLAAYVFYTAQIIYFLRYTGRYGILMPLLHPLSSIFFLIIMLYSLYQVTFKGSVSWKGRQVPVGERRTL